MNGPDYFKHLIHSEQNAALLAKLALSLTQAHDSPRVAPYDMLKLTPLNRAVASAFVIWTFSNPGFSFDHISLRTLQAISRTGLKKG